MNKCTTVLSELKVFRRGNTVTKALRESGLAVLISLQFSGCQGVVHQAPEEDLRLSRVQNWIIQLQGLDQTHAQQRIVDASVDMVVMDSIRTVKGQEYFPTRDLVRRVQSEGKLCLAYLNIGQAESYRSYWKESWRAPERDHPGDPEFLITVDPDGWVGDYPVAFWDLEWQRIVENQLAGVIADGFDGIYCDWVLGYEEPQIVEAARAEGRDPAYEMVLLIGRLRTSAHRMKPGFLIVAQNGASLIDEVPGYASRIDAIVHEDLSFRGIAGADWNDPQSGDIETNAGATQELVKALTKYRDQGVTVFTLDYALIPENVERAKSVSRRAGFIPCVTRIPLDRF